MTTYSDRMKAAAEQGKDNPLFGSNRERSETMWWIDMRYAGRPLFVSYDGLRDVWQVWASYRPYGTNDVVGVFGTMPTTEDEVARAIAQKAMAV